MQSTIKNRTIFCRDNLEILRGIDSNSIDLIYLDPPFNKKKQFAAPIGSGAEGASFRDIFRKADIKEEWLGLIADKHPILNEYINGIGNIGHKSNKYYLCYMAVRLIEMHRILKDTGSLYLHCDKVMSHYLKLLLDCVFGESNFRNEIIWYYTNAGGRGKRHYAKKHNSIHWYSKSSKYFFDGTRDGQERQAGKTSKGGRMYTENGKKYQQIWSSGKSYTYCLSDNRIADSVWSIQPIPPHSPINTGYPTQKPTRLLERIITNSSNEGDIVLDPFCGCATTCVASEKLGRQWVGIDVSDIAFHLVSARLENEIDGYGLFKSQGGKLPKLIKRADIPQRTDGETFMPTIDDRHKLFGIQEGMCNGCRRVFPFVNFTLDHIVPRSKGGGDNYENLQLLCHRCNAVKGDRNMEYLLNSLRNEQVI